MAQAAHGRQRCEVYSRVVGYYRPVKQWNKGKKAEFQQRREFEIDEHISKKAEQAEPDREP